VPLRGVIFDLDGTLIDSREADMEALARALEQLTGEPIRHDRLNRFFGVSSREAAEELVGADAPALLELWSSAYHTDLGEKVRIFPGVADVLRSLRLEGLRLGVVTLQTREELRQTRKALPLDGWIEVWVAVDDTQRPKPSPEPLLLALQKLELKPAQAVIVGDSVKDIQAGRAAGVWTGAALWGSVEVEALIDLKPDYIFRQAHELRSLWDHKTEP